MGWEGSSDRFLQSLFIKMTLEAANTFVCLLQVKWPWRACFTPNPLVPFPQQSGKSWFPPKTPGPTSLKQVLAPSSGHLFCLPANQGHPRSKFLPLSEHYHVDMKGNSTRDFCPSCLPNSRPAMCSHKHPCLCHRPWRINWFATAV